MTTLEKSMKYIRRAAAALLTICLLTTGGAAGFCAALAEMIPAAGTPAATDEITSRDGWIYRLSADGEAILTGSTDPAAESLILPDEVDGHWVAAVGDNAFADHAALKHLRAPASIRSWPDSAFAGAEEVTVEARNGTAALGFAKNRGFQVSNLSEYDFQDDILDLSDISRSEFTLSGSTLTVDGPWARSLKEGGRVYLPANGIYRNGVPLEIESLRLSGNSATAAVKELDLQEALRSYHVENALMKPDWSRAMPLMPGVAISPASGTKRSGTRGLDSGEASTEIGIRLDLGGGNEINGKLKADMYCLYTVDMDWFEVTYTEARTTVSLSGELTWSKKLYENPLMDKSIFGGDFDIAKVPLVGGGLGTIWAYVKLDFEVDKETTIKYEYSVTTTMIADHGKATCDRTEPVKRLTMSSGITATLEFKVGIEIDIGFSDNLGFTLFDIHFGIGFEAKMESSPNSVYCYDVTLKGYLSASVMINLILFEINQSPKWYYPIWEKHFELDTLSFMDKDWCSYTDECKVKLYYGYETIEEEEAAINHTITVEKGQPISDPGSPSRPGYTFCGWFADTECAQAWDFFDPVNENMILYAGWIKDGDPDGTPIVIMPPPPPPEPMPDPDDVAFDIRLRTVGQELKGEITGWSCWTNGHGSDLVHLVIPETYQGNEIESIGRSVFANCHTLRRVVIPDTVKTIYPRAFSGCDNLEEVVLGSGIETIYPDAFSYCPKLKELTLPDSVQYLGDGFAEKTGVTVFNVPMNLRHDNMTFSTAGSISSNFTKIVVPEGMKTVDLRYYFPTYEYAESIEEIVLPDSVETIGAYCFKNAKITSIPWPANLRKIEAYAFANCDGLEDVRLPDAISMETGIFAGCDHIKTLNYPKGKGGGSAEGRALHAFIGCDSLEEVIIPEGVEALTGETFANTAIKRVTLPSTMKYIGNEVFANCPRLKDVHLNDGLISMGQDVFAGCGALDRLTLPDTLKRMGSTPFAGTAISEITIPAGIEACPNLAGCSSLERICFEEGMERLPDYALGCDFAKTHVFLPESLKTIGRYGFAGSCSLNCLRIPAGVEELEEYAFYGCGYGEDFDLQLNISRIGARVFAESGFTSVHLPDTVELISPDAFAYSYVESINLPPHLNPELFFSNSFRNARIRNVQIPEGVDYIPVEIFRNLPLERVVLPSTVQLIGGDAFSGTNIESIVIPQNAACDGWPFCDCPRLESITFLCDASLWSLYPFYGRENTPLKRILVPEASCPEADWFRREYPEIELIQIPATAVHVTFMNGQDVYEQRMGCSGELLLPVADPEKKENRFTGWYRDAECTTPWNFETDKLPPYDVTLYAGWDIATDVFTWQAEDGKITLLYYTGSTQGLRIPETLEGMPVTALGSGFLNDRVVRLQIPASVTRIEPGAFRFASVLTTITTEEGGTYTAEDGVLYEGSRLICYPAGQAQGDVTVPARATGIGSYAFSGCAGMRTLAVHGGITALEDFAVYDCRRLEKVTFEADPESVGAGFLGNCAAGAAVFGPIEAPALAACCDSVFVPYNMYEVTYMQGDTVLGKARARAGKLLTNLTTMKDESRTFRGWARDPELNTPWDMDNDVMPAEPLTLYAVWTDDFVTENAEGGVRLVLYTGSRTTVAVPETLGGAPVVEIAGDCFGSGAFILRGNKGSLTEAFAESRENLTFEPYTYTVTFDSRGGTAAAALTLCATDEVTLPEVSKPGFTLAGWYTDRTLATQWTGGTLMPAHNLTLYAGWMLDDENAQEILLTYENTAGGIRITGYTGTDDRITVPEEINGLTVTAVAPGAFANRRTLRSVTLPDTVQTIGERAFEGCSALLSIRLPAGLQEIAPYTFLGCRWLTNITMPAGLKSAGAYAFGDCEALKAISLGSAIEQIDINAFRGCGSLEAITADSPYYVSVDGVLFSPDGTELILYPEGKSDSVYTVPAGTTAIREYAMCDSHLRTLALNSEMRTIGAYALSGSMYLREMTMNDGLTVIGANAFSGCASLRNVRLPAGLEFLGTGAFHSCPLISLIVDSDDVILEAGCVDASRKLTIFGNRGSTARTYAAANGIRFAELENAVALTALELPETLTIREFTSAQLAALPVPANALTELVWVSDDEDVAEVDQNGLVTGIEAGETTITVTDPSGVRAECAVTVLMWEPVTIQVTGLSLPAAGFRLAPGEAAAVPVTVTPREAGKLRLTWSVADKNVAAYVDGCVIAVGYGETTLTVTAESGVTASCPILVPEPPAFGTPDLVLPARLQEILPYTFEGIAATVVKLPEGVTGIGDGAFANCGGLIQIYIPGSCVNFGEDVFDGCPEGLLIFGAAGSEAQRYAADNGLTFVPVLWRAD